MISVNEENTEERIRWWRMIHQMWRSLKGADKGQGRRKGFGSSLHKLWQQVQNTVHFGLF